MLIAEIIKKHNERQEKQKARSERADIIRQFVEELNAERDGKKYRKLTPYVVAIKLSHIKKKVDLYAFLAMCRDRKLRNGSFSKYFWWAIKPQENKQQKLI